MTTPANPADLITWLRAQLDEDERVALAAGGEHPTWTQGGPDWIESDAEVRFVTRPDEAGIVDDAGNTVVYDEGRPPVLDTHIARHDPARVLAEVDAKRRILDEHFESMLGDTGIGAGDCTTCMNYAWPCPTVRLLALPYADRPGYREEWRPA